MKKLIFLMVSVIILAIPSEAQLVRSRTFGEKEKKGYDRITVGYEAMFLNEEMPTLDGVNLQYIHGFRVAKVPLFVEIGVGVTYNTKNVDTGLWFDYYEDYYYFYPYKERINSLSVRIPVNISYKINFGEKFSILPYTGVNFKLNPLFDMPYLGYLASFDEQKGSYCIIDKGENKFFQAGWQIGAGFTLSKFYVGIQYGLDFLPKATISKYTENKDSYGLDLKSSHLLVSVGVQF